MDRKWTSYVILKNVDNLVFHTKTCKDDACIILSINVQFTDFIIDTEKIKTYHTGFQYYNG